jgi:hypothetical protein
MEQQDGLLVFLIDLRHDLFYQDMKDPLFQPHVGRRGIHTAGRS